MTLIVADTSRSRPPAGARRPPGASGAEAPRQWSCSWTATGPGPVSAGCPGEPELTLTLSPTDAELVSQARLSPSVAFMQGRLKTSGDNALLLRVLAWSATGAFAPALAAWSAQGTAH
ncbi:MAG: SCP2 sterol-binding domain-containing protein [Acidimicrobiales bacterium]